MTQASPTEGTSRDTRADHALGTPETLRQAMRRARHDDAERSGVQAELRIAQIVRLEMLQEALKPLLVQIPAEAVDLFDVGIMPGATPRLFVDMIGFVEMGRDSRVYHLIQDTRYARLTIAESVDMSAMVEAVTQYIARRLVEREKALAASPSNICIGKKGSARPRRGRRARWMGIAFAFVIDLLGAVTFFTLVAIAGWLLWNRLHGRA